MVYLSIFLSLFLLSCGNQNFSDPTQSPEKIIVDQKTSSGLVGQYYRDRYKVKAAYEKVVDNRGDGFEPLYGMRNFRAVLNGVYYRGGANNVYHRTNKRDNMNPLQNDGLENLCKEGFTQAIYLYTENFSTAPRSTNCRTSLDGEQNKLTYDQYSSLSSDPEMIRRILSVVYDHIQNPQKGPIYAHCWNGWHASGFAAAAALKQFCGFTGDQAISYWNLNTDGNYQQYDSIRKKIKNFVPYPEMIISPDIKRVLCPDPLNLTFVQQ